MNCIIVDDDNNCIKALEGIIKNYLPKLTVCGTAGNIGDAIKLIHSNKIELLFLDVELQSETGFDLFKFIPKPDFEIVFTTAHEKYALKAIKSSCFDFLLKPIDISELIHTVTRLEQSTPQHMTERAEILLDNISGNNRKVSKLAFPTKDEMIFIDTKDIMYLEGEAKYTTLHLMNGIRYVSSKNIGEFEEMLNPEMFFRCHRSWIVNLSCITKFLKNDSQIVLSNGELISVSTRKKDEFLRLFEKI